MARQGASIIGAAPGPARAAQDAAANPWMQRLARAGYATRGVVYIIIGALAAKAATGAGGATTDRRGAIEAIYHEPFGKVLLILVAVGLIGYALWGLVQGGADTEGKGSDAKGIATRVGYAVGGLSYGFLAVTALQIALGTGSGGKNSDQSTQDWTRRLMEQPFGTSLVVIAGLVVAGVAVAEIYRAYTATFMKRLTAGGMSARDRQWVLWLGRCGRVARGIVFGIIAIFLIVAALRHNAGQAKGLAGALHELARQPSGQILLGVVAIGLIAYGAFSFAEARYRRVGADEAALRQGR